MKDNTDFLTEIVYPDGIERSTIGKVPAKQPDNITKGAYILSSAILSLVRAGYKVEKINMDDLKPPYILLANHMQFMDFAMLFRATYPHKVNVVAAFNVFHLFPKTMEKAGCICTHKFTTDTALVRSCKKVLKEYGDVFCRMTLSAVIYRQSQPDEGCSICAITDIIPVWWEFHTFIDGDEVLNDFSFNELREYIQSLV